MIHCPHCKKDKEASEFNANGSRKSGKQLWCRECTIAYNRKWYSENTESHNNYVGEQKHRNQSHVCNYCGRSALEVGFHTRRVAGHTYPCFICVECKAKYRKKYPTTADAIQRGRKKQAARGRIDRANPEKRAKHIVGDSKNSDKKKYRDNDLDVEFVSSLISNPCSYCGSFDEKMTLDRIDNDLGHTKANVIASCVQCNYFRRNMPYEAWSLLVPGMREARKRGLLSAWTFGTHKSRKKDVDQSTLDIVKEL